MRKLLSILMILFMMTLPASAQDFENIDWALIAAYWGTAIADVETTQSCLNRMTCREANPLMPSNRAGAYGVKAAAFVSLFFWLKYADEKKPPRIMFGVISGVQGTVATLNLRF